LIGNSRDSGLIPAPLGSPDAKGNLIGGPTDGTDIDPLLAPLSNKGGPTMTHELLVGSPALDVGDPAAMAGVGDVPAFDQRGTLFARVVDGNSTSGARIDIGAFESQTVGPALPGDYYPDGVVDAADYLVWRRTLGRLNVPPFSGADGNGDGVIDEDDYTVWRANFGAIFSAIDNGANAAAAAILDDDQGLAMSRRAVGTRQFTIGMSSFMKRDEALLAWLAARTDRTAIGDRGEDNLPLEHDDSVSAYPGEIDAALEQLALLAG
jgi:hypothetical protein